MHRLLRLLVFALALLMLIISVTGIPTLASDGWSPFHDGELIGQDSITAWKDGVVFWRENLVASGGDLVNVILQDGSLTLGDQQFHQKVFGPGRGYGVLTMPVRQLVQSINQIAVTFEADVPAGAEVLIDVRVRPRHGLWSEWQPVTVGQPTLLPLSGSDVQTRLILLDDGQGHAPVIHRLEFTGDTVPTAEVAAQPGLLTATIFASREGLVGYRTANGHIITEYDRFVALPSFRGLCSAARNPCEYMVELYYPKTGKRTRAPVWDVGPWNTKDDYWNPSSIRQMWRDLPRGTPEAEAAYLNGYNGGRDQFGRRVSSPAGIDLADGTFWADLGMSHSDWIEVTYLWTAGGTPGGGGSDGNVPDNGAADEHSSWYAIVDNPTSERFIASSNWGTSSVNGQRYGPDYRFTTPQAMNDPAWYTFNLPEKGNYEIYVWYPAKPTYNSATPYIVKASTGDQVIPVDQRVNGGQWNSLGTFALNAGECNVLGVSRWTSTPGYIIADAVKLVQR